MARVAIHLRTALKYVLASGRGRLAGSGDLAESDYPAKYVPAIAMENDWRSNNAKSCC